MLRFSDPGHTHSFTKEYRTLLKRMVADLLFLQWGSAKEELRKLRWLMALDKASIVEHRERSKVPGRTFLDEA